MCSDKQAASRAVLLRLHSDSSEKCFQSAYFQPVPSAEIMHLEAISDLIINVHLSSFRRSKIEAIWLLRQISGV